MSLDVYLRFHKYWIIDGLFFPVQLFAIDTNESDNDEFSGIVEF